MKSLSLSREVKIEKYEVLVEIGRQYKREELISILKLAQECSGKIRAEDICDRLLIGRPIFWKGCVGSLHLPGIS